MIKVNAILQVDAEPDAFPKLLQTAKDDKDEKQQ